MDQFAHAWEGSGFHYTATDIPLSSQASFNASGFDVGAFLGVGTTLLTGDPIAGAFVHDIADGINWDEVLMNL